MDNVTHIYKHRAKSRDRPGEKGEITPPTPPKPYHIQLDAPLALPFEGGVLSKPKLHDLAERLRPLIRRFILMLRRFFHPINRFRGNRLYGKLAMLAVKLNRQNFGVDLTCRDDAFWGREIKLEVRPGKWHRNAATIILLEGLMPGEGYSALKLRYFREAIKVLKAMSALQGPVRSLSPLRTLNPLARRSPKSGPET